MVNDNVILSYTVIVTHDEQIDFILRWIFLLKQFNKRK